MWGRVARVETQEATSGTGEIVSQAESVQVGCWVERRKGVRRAAASAEYLEGYLRVGRNWYWPLKDMLEEWGMLFLVQSMPLFIRFEDLGSVHQVLFR